MYLRNRNLDRKQDLSRIPPHKQASSILSVSPWVLMSAAPRGFLTAYQHNHNVLAWQNCHMRFDIRWCCNQYLRRTALYTMGRKEGNHKLLAWQDFYILLGSHWCRTNYLGCIEHHTQG
jgi:hypothetical protein